MSCGGHPLFSSSLNYIPGKVYKYSYSTSSIFKDVSTNTKSQNVGINFNTIIEIVPIWQNEDGQLLIKLSLLANPTLHGEHFNDQTRKLTILPKLSLYFLWNKGVIISTYSHYTETTLSLNIKKGIASLFQFQYNKEQEHKEIDSSGECDVTYKKESLDKIIKIKNNCLVPNSNQSFSNVNEPYKVYSVVETYSEYAIKDDLINSVNSREIIINAINIGNFFKSSLTVRQQIQLLEISIFSESLLSGSLEDAIKEIFNENKNLKPIISTLITSFEIRSCIQNCKKLSDVVKQLKDNLKSTLIGQNIASVAFQKLLKEFRLASKSDILKVLKSHKNDDFLYPMIDLVTASQTPASHQALITFLSFKDESESNVKFLERFLLAAALTSHPSLENISYLLKLSEKKYENENLQESIGEALGAIIYTYQRLPNHNIAIVNQVRQSFLKKFDSCKAEKSCLLKIIRAMANAGFSETGDILLTLAETTDDPAISEAALKALKNIDKFILENEFRERLKDIFHMYQQFYTTSIRSQALNYLLEMFLDYKEVRSIYLESLDPSNSEYDLYIQSRLISAAQHNPRLGKLLKEVLKNVKLNNYHVRAPKGTSLAFSSKLFDNPETSYLMYVENGKSGVLQRSGMNVDLIHFTGIYSLYKFEIFATGLESILGGGEESSELSAGMSLDMVGVSLRPITFFEGQGGLMSAIWNAPSEPLSALQVNFLLQDHISRIYLQNGLIAELDVTGVVSIDLSGSLSVSLWNKNSKSLIANRGSLAIKSEFRIETGTFKIGTESTEQVESSIDFQTDVDFSSDVRMCLQMSRPQSELKQTREKFESVKGYKKIYKSVLNKISKSSGISYPLPQANYQQCRSLMSNL